MVPSSIEKHLSDHTGCWNEQPNRLFTSNSLLIKNKIFNLAFETMLQENFAWYLTPPSRRLNMGITDL